MKVIMNINERKTVYCKMLSTTLDLGISIKLPQLNLAPKMKNTTFIALL